MTHCRIVQAGARQTAHLPDGASLTIAADHPELAAWLRKADVATQAGDYQACQGALREWMKGWRAAVHAHQLAKAA